MLQTIRDKITGVVATVFLGAIAVVFVFWGIDFKSGAQDFAAKVDGETIPTQTLRQAWQQRQRQLQQMLRDELPEDLKKQQQQAMLDQLVRQTLLSQRAERTGYRVTDEALARRVMEHPAFQVDGKFSKDRYIAMLRSVGIDEGRFESELQDELLINQLQASVVDSAFVAPYELQRRYALEKQEREIDYALVPASQFASVVTVGEEQVQKYYEEHKSNDLLPETVDLQYVELTREQAESGITVTDEALKEYYEQVKDRFESPERRRGRHILITAGDGMDDAAALKKAEELTAKAQAGGDFALLAKDNSKDPGSASQGGDLGWAQRGMFVGPFEEALFTMKPGEIRGPVKTQFGYHVLKLEEIEAGHSRSLEEARAEVEAEYRRQRAETVFSDQSQQLADAAFSALTELESVAKAMNLPIRTLKGFTRQGGGELGQEPEVIKAAFSEDVLERRENSSLLGIGEERAVVLRVTDHTPAEPRPLADVRAGIEEQLKVQAARDAAAAKGAEAVARLQKGEPWADVVKAMQLTPAGKRVMTRQDSIAPPAVLKAAFSAPGAGVSETKPHYAGTATDDGNYAVYALTQVRSADSAAEPAADKVARTRRTERQVGGEEFAGYVAEAERTADIQKNEKAFE